MKQKIFTILLIFTLITRPTYPTFATEITQVAGWGAQAYRWEQHVEWLSKELLAKTGIREIIQFKRDMMDLHRFLKQNALDFMDLADDIINHPKSVIGRYAKRLFDDYMLFDNCNYDYMSSDYKRICRESIISNVMQIATYQETSKQIKSIASKLKDITLLRTLSKDVKMSTDLASSVNMEIAQLQLITTQLRMMEAQYKNKQEIYQRQMKQLLSKERNPANVSKFIHQNFIR